MVRYIYEFIGTFFLVLTVGMSVYTAGPLAPFAIGSILAVMVYAAGHISGGHFNPAISLAVYLRGKLNLLDFGYYCAAQVIGSILAALITLYFVGNMSSEEVRLIPLKALIAEFLFTFALCFVVLNVATTKATASNSFFGFAIGFTVLAGAFAVGTISGAAFNPAVALGVAIMNLNSWTNLWIYIIGNFLGGAAAAYVFNYAHPKEQKS